MLFNFFKTEILRVISCALVGLGALTVFSACGPKYKPAPTGPLHFKLIVAPKLSAAKLGTGYDSTNHRFLDNECVLGSAVGRYQSARASSFEPITTVAVNPTRENVLSALVNMSPISKALSSFQEVQDFADMSAGTKKNLIATRMVLVKSEIFGFGRDKTRNPLALSCADRFVSHVYAGAALAVSVKVEFQSSQSRSRFVDQFGMTAPFGPGDFSSQAREIGESLATSNSDMNFTVFQMGGDSDETQSILAHSHCEISNLEACSDTLAILETSFKKNLSFPDSPTRLRGFVLTDYATSPYD